MEIILFWLFFSVIIAVYASKKGHNAVSTFVISIFLSPVVGFLVTVVRDANHEALEADSIAKGKQKKCPYCAELVKAEAIICKHCGKDLSKVDIKKQQESIEQERELKNEIDKLKSKISSMKWDANSDTSNLEHELENLEMKLRDK